MQWLKVGPPPRPTLFPYTTLFRSAGDRAQEREVVDEELGQGEAEEGEAADSQPADPALQAQVEGDEADRAPEGADGGVADRKSTRLNSSHGYISYAVFCLKKKTPA